MSAILYMTSTKKKSQGKKNVQLYQGSNPGPSDYCSDGLPAATVTFPCLIVIRPESLSHWHTTITNKEKYIVLLI